jgi:hypothetical protein
MSKICAVGITFLDYLLSCVLRNHLLQAKWYTVRQGEVNHRLLVTRVDFQT